MATVNPSENDSAGQNGLQRLSNDWSLVNLDWANCDWAAPSSLSSRTPQEDCFSVFAAKHTSSGANWLSISLQGWNVVACLLEQFGYPPYPVVLDWKKQAAAQSKSAPAKLSDVPLSHLLVAADGRLVSLDAITQFVVDQLSDESNNQTQFRSGNANGDSVLPFSSLPVDMLSLVPLPLNELIDTAKKTVLIENEFTNKSLGSFLALERKPRGNNSSVQKVATNNLLQDEFFAIASSNDLESTAALSSATIPGLINDASSNGTVGRNKKASESKAKISSRTLGIGIAAGVVVLLGGYFLFNSNSNSLALSKSRTKLDGSNSDSSALSNADLPVSDAKVANKPASKNEKQNNAEAEIGSLNSDNEPSQDELIVDVPGVTALDADMSMTQSPEELMSSLSSSLAANKGDGVPGETDDVSAFLKLLQEPTDPIAPEKQSAEAGNRNPGSPFDEANEPGKDGSLMDLGDEDALENENASKSEDLPIDEKEKANKLVLEEKWKLENLPFKASYKVPFVTADKSSVCRVRLRLAEDMLVKPMEPIVITGRKDVSWTVALEDDAASLRLFLRSKPGRTWGVLAAMRLKFVDGSEIPIVPGQTTYQRRQLEELLLNLEQQRDVLDNLRFSRRQQNVAMQLKTVVDQKRKEIEKSIKLWEKIDELANAFFLSHELEMTFAAREEFLPVLAESDE